MPSLDSRFSNFEPKIPLLLLDVVLLQGGGSLIGRIFLNWLKMEKGRWLENVMVLLLSSAAICKCS